MAVDVGEAACLVVSPAVASRRRYRQLQEVSFDHRLVAGLTCPLKSSLKDCFEVSERRQCQVLRQPRATQRYLPKVRDDEQPLTRRIIELASIFGRYGYRQVTALLRLDGWWVNHKRVERIWRREGLKVSKKQPKRGRLWLNDGSCIRLRVERRDHVWAYDFVHGRTHEGRSFRMLTLVDEYTR